MHVSPSLNNIGSVINQDNYAIMIKMQYRQVFNVHERMSSTRNVTLYMNFSMLSLYDLQWKKITIYITQ